MSSVALEVLLIFILIIANGIFAMSETAVISSRKARLQQRANEGDKKARAALDLIKAPNAFLATVQVGITLIGILAGAFGGATIAEQLADILAPIPVIGPYSEALALAIVIILITYFSLIVGELVPKNLALSNPEGIASTFARPMSMLAKVFSPIISLLNWSTNVTLKLLGVKPARESAVTEEEVKIMIEQGRRAGVFQRIESTIVEQIFRLNDLRVEAVMTPRTEIVWFDVDDTVDAVQQGLANSGHSHYPVAQGSLDSVIGVVHTKDLLARQLSGEPLDLKMCLQTPLFIPESTPALRMLEAVRKARTHLAFVMDEYGGVQGLVTVSDLLEEIMGGAGVSTSADDNQAVKRRKGPWILDGMTPVDTLKETLQIKKLPYEGKGLYQTLSGFVMLQTGRIPAVSDQFEFDNLRFEVVSMDGRRVDKVRVVALAPTT